MKVVAEITMSIDGFIAGPDISNENPMGLNGPLLHQWIFDKATDEDREWLRELTDQAGAVIMGNHTYQTAIDEAWEGKCPFSVPVFVLCHQEPAKKIEGFVYVTTDAADALKQARKTADQKNVWIMGGAKTIQHYLRNNDIDQLRLHIVPLLLGKGTRLFGEGQELTELELTFVSHTQGALHGVWKVKKG